MDIHADKIAIYKKLIKLIKKEGKSKQGKAYTHDSLPSMKNSLN